MNGIETVESLKNSVHSLKKKEKNDCELNAKKIKQKQKKSSSILTLKYQQNAIDISVQSLETNNLMKIVF